MKIDFEIKKTTMKKLLFFFALSFPLLGNAQTTALPLPADGSVWVTYDLFPNETFGTSLAPSEVLGFDYYLTPDSIPNCSNNTGFLGQTQNFTQIDNKWFVGGYLFFDWDFVPGDSFFTYVFSGDIITVTSIDTVIYADFIPRRRYHIAYSDGTPVYRFGMETYYIEGIGTNTMGCYVQDFEQLFLLCFYDKNGLLIYQNDWSNYHPGVPNSCCPIISVDETTFKSFKLFPSPATNQSSLQFESAHIPQSIQIFNATGQLMHTEQVLGRIQMQVNVSEYANGIYTVRARFENGEEVSERLVVE